VPEQQWWRHAAIYQVYPRSFADGDGVGDLAGIRARLGHLRDLGVDALWFSPWYPVAKVPATATRAPSGLVSCRPAVSISAAGWPAAPTTRTFRPGDR
jgi:hypothetical protein